MNFLFKVLLENQWFLFFLKVFHFLGCEAWIQDIIDLYLKVKALNQNLNQHVEWSAISIKCWLPHDFSLKIEWLSQTIFRLICLPAILEFQSLFKQLISLPAQFFDLNLLVVSHQAQVLGILWVFVLLGHLLVDLSYFLVKLLQLLIEALVGLRLRILRLLTRLLLSDI